MDWLGIIGRVRSTLVALHFAYAEMLRCVVSMCRRTVSAISESSTSDPPQGVSRMLTGNNAGSRPDNHFPRLKVEQPCERVFGSPDQ